MAGKKQAKKAGAKKAAKKAAAKKAPARKTAAKKPGAKKTAKKAGIRGEAPGRAKKTEAVELVEGSWESEGAAAEYLGKSWEKKWAKVVAKSWTDPAFKQQLLESPGRTLAAEGLPLLRDVEVRIVAGSEGKFTMEIPLPDRPGDLDGELIDDLLQDFHTKPGQGPKRCVMSSCCC